MPGLLNLRFLPVLFKPVGSNGFFGYCTNAISPLHCHQTSRVKLFLRGGRVSAPFLTLPLFLRSSDWRGLRKIQLFWNDVETLPPPTLVLFHGVPQGLHLGGVVEHVETEVGSSASPQATQQSEVVGSRLECPSESMPWGYTAQDLCGKVAQCPAELDRPPTP